MSISSFIITFKDGESIVFSDVITFEQHQKDEIQSIASQYSKFALQSQKNGIDINTITATQKNEIIRIKNHIVRNLSSEQLKNKKIIKINGKHFEERVLKRLRSNSTDVIIGLIDRIKRANATKKSQFKGYEQLSYSIIEINDPDEFMFAMSFEKKKNKRKTIFLITVTLEKEIPEEMEQRVGDNPKFLEMLEKFKQQFKKD